jgi:hypothetical protein
VIEPTRLDFIINLDKAKLLGVPAHAGVPSGTWFNAVRRCYQQPNEGLFPQLAPNGPADGPMSAYGPQAALIAESFTGRLRYSGASLGYQLASVIAGGPAPLIATWLFVKYNSAYAVAAYIFVCAVLTLIATAMMKDYTGKISRGSTNRGMDTPL